MIEGKTLGERLKHLRGSRTQEEISTALGLSRARYSHYENNRVEPDTILLNKMADFFDVSIDYLLGRTDNPNPINNQEEDNPISIAFSHGGENLTDDEKEHLEAELKRYRELKARFMREKNRE